MSKTRHSAKPQDRAITSEEAELWEQATRSLARLKSKPRVSRAEPVAATSAGAPVSRRGANAVTPAKMRAVVALAAAPVAELDRRQARRIAAGKIELDGSIDLHGLRQAEAHARLRAFLSRAYAQGLKTVLVITGKGVAGEHGPTSLELEASPRGVLRRSVPLWLAREDLSQIVASYGAAGSRHGGSGAFYVRLRKSPHST
jgi:DNA-nicking Smr family endonuclease